MTKKEVLKILAVCKGAGVNFGDADSNILVEIWTRCFENNSYEEVSKALFELINSKKSLFLNGLIGEIKAQIVSDTTEFEDFSSVWETLRTAMHKTHPDIPEETSKAFSSLPPMLRHLVGSPQHLQDMEYCLDRHELETVERSNMKKMYSELVQNTKERLQLGRKPVWLDYQPNRKLENMVSKLTEGKEF